MCERVAAIAGALRQFVAGVDADSVPLPEVAGLWDELSVIERLASGAKTLLARRVEESRVWHRQGYGSAAEYLAARSGETVGVARACLGTSKRLADLGATAEALRSGSLSSAQVASVADAASVNRSAEAALLASARAESVAGLRAEAARAKAVVHPDPDAAHRRIHQSRRLRSFCDSEGAWNLVARGTPDDGSRILAGLAPLIDEAFRRARAEGRHEPREAYAFDALVAMASPGQYDGEAVKSTKARVRPSHLSLLRVDASALARGSTEADEVCEIAGVGPVPVSRARALLGESVVKLVITKGNDVVNVTNLGRGPTAAQRVALLWSSPGCSVVGCNRTRVEIDHRIPWAESHQTRLDGLDPLCSHHHALKTRQNWALVEGNGKRPMVAPDDPRHPDRGRLCLVDAARAP